jgi:hypothetical protein
MNFIDKLFGDKHKPKPEDITYVMDFGFSRE